MRHAAAVLILAALPAPLLADDAAPPKIINGGSGKLELREWAPRGRVRNPVALTVNDRGWVYTAEAERYCHSVLDVRGPHGMSGNLQKFDSPPRGSAYFVEKDLPLCTVEERIALEKAWEGENYFPKGWFTAREDALRLSKDTDGDGVADASTIFATFGGHGVGLNSGVLELDGAVYDTCIPDLWRLEDKDGDGKADAKAILSHGWGVRMSLGGHDFHALVQGPDGRLYFSVGDRSYNLTTAEGVRYDLITAANPAFDANGSRESAKHRFHHCSGAVFRCWPDGSGLERVYEGLRNPQGLAFDNLGNLFTGDNTCDFGDAARFCYLADYGSAGWDQDNQSVGGGIWIRERMWGTRRAPHDPLGHAWLVPPIGHVGNGPAGMSHFPGTGHAAKFDDRLLMANFNGGGGNLFAVKAEADGAFFKVGAVQDYGCGFPATDAQWGPDGRLYCSDFAGWDWSGNGRVVTLTDPAVFADPAQKAAIDEVRKLLGEGMGARTPEALRALLGHRDQRVRNRAQNELARRPGMEAALLAQAADAKQARLARVHALWTLWQKAGFDQAHGKAPSFGLAALEPLLADADPALRTQAVRVLGDLRHPAPQAYIRLLKDADAQARFHAAVAIGKTRAAPAVPALLDLLAENADHDPVLRHGGNWALAQLAEGTDGEALVKAAAGRGADERLGVVLALRRLRSPRLANFLADPAPQVVVEAARAIFDQEVLPAYPALADTLASAPDAAKTLEPYWRRAIEAAASAGRPKDATLLAGVVCGPWPSPAKQFALQALRDWNQPIARDRVWAHLVNRPALPVERVQAVVATRAGDLLAAADKDASIKGAVGEVLGRHLPKMAAAEMVAQALDAGRDPSYRLALIERLRREAPKELPKVLGPVLAQPGTPSTLRIRVLALLTEVDPAAALRANMAILAQDGAPLAERQAAVRGLAANPLPAAGIQLAWLWRDFGQGRLAPELGLDVLEAAAASADPTLKAQAGAWQSSRLYTSGFEGMRQVVPNPVLLAGGDPVRGERLFRDTPTEKACTACHNAGDAARWDIFDAGHEPDGKGGGFPNLGRTGADHDLSYLARAIVDPEADIAAGFSRPSPMPRDYGSHLAAVDIRDLVAFLATRRGDAAGKVAPTAEASATHAGSAGIGAKVFAGMLLPLAAFLALVGGCTWFFGGRRR